MPNFLEYFDYSNKKNSLFNLSQKINYFYHSHKKNKSNGFLVFKFLFFKKNNKYKTIRVLVSFYNSSQLNNCYFFFLPSDESYWQNFKFFFFAEKNFNECQKKLRKEFPGFNPLSGFFLQPIVIAKPWGQEIWFTGIEKRGVSWAQSNFSTKLVPLDEVLFVNQCFTFLHGGYIKDKVPLLLKILKPLPDKIYGQLYYELHEKKKEVYIISKVNKKIYSKGVGKIRLGFNPNKLKEFKNFQLFLKAKLKAAWAYKKIRFQIDKKIPYPQAVNDPKSYLNHLKKWFKKIPLVEKKSEKKAREELESFSNYLDLKVGDVVTINAKTPHALQGGVEAIEFQTPHYERLIIAYPQKVLTQNHWNITKAFQVMRKNIQLPKKNIVKNNDDICIEKCVAFSDFQVYKIFFKQIKMYNIVEYFKVVRKEIIIFNLSTDIAILLEGKRKTLKKNTTYLFPIPMVKAKKTFLENQSKNLGYVLIGF